MSVSLVGLRAVVLVFLILCALVVWLPVTTLHSPSEENLVVRFYDVGQGDAIHIITPDGFEVLIDGGATASILRELSVGRSFFDREIDLMIATHPDTDHVGGLVDVLERYQVNSILQTEAEHDAPAALAFDRAVEAEGAEVIFADAGQVITLGASTTMRVLSPASDTSNWENNAASIIVQVTYGDIEFMLTGDAPASIENYLTTIHGTSLESEVLKLGHHGSKTSTSELFLKTVEPEYAVVSAGSDNRYGHPHSDVIDRTLSVGTEVLSTAEDGTIVFHSDGKRVWLE